MVEYFVEFENSFNKLRSRTLSIAERMPVDILLLSSINKEFLSTTAVPLNTLLETSCTFKKVVRRLPKEQRYQNL